MPFGRCDESAQSVVQDPLRARGVARINPTRRRAMTGTRYGVRVVSTLAVFGILFAPVHAIAQVAVGTLVGSVRDDTGGGVPGATVTATETRTNITRTALSNESGNYSFNNLAPGVYRVDGELVGFKKFSREGVEVSVNTTVRVEIVLAVGQL